MVLHVCAGVRVCGTPATIVCFVIIVQKPQCYAYDCNAGVFLHVDDCVFLILLRVGDCGSVREFFCLGLKIKSSVEIHNYLTDNKIE